MSDPSVLSIRRLFGVTDEVLARRERAGDYIHSFASLIVDAFVDEHMLEDEQFSRAVATVDAARIKRGLTEYLIALFQAPFDARLLDRIANIGVFPFQMRLEPIHVRKGSETIQQIVCELARVNEQILADLPLLLKFLRIAEYVMVEACEGTRRREEDEDVGHNALIDSFGELFRIHSIHSGSVELAERLLDVDSREAAREKIADCLRHPEQSCPVSDIMDGFEGADVSALPQFDLEQAVGLHDEYRRALADFILMIDEGLPETELTRAFNLLKKRSGAFLTTIARPLQDIAAVSFLAVSSGFRFINQVSHNLFEQEASSLETWELAELVELELPRLLTDTMGWCIADLGITRVAPDGFDFDIVSAIRLKQVRLHMGIKLKDLPNKLYLQELVQMMIEIVRINLLNKEREATLVELADTAERANQAKNAFLANMSHELRTPLNAIIGFSQILETRSDLPSTLRPFIEKIRLSGNNLLHLVNTILDFAKLEADKVTCEPRATVIGDVVREAVLLTESMAREKEITLEYPRVMSPVVEMDPQLIKQVLVNLLSNAVKFTPDGGRVWIDVGFSEARAAYEISVGDDGVGIAEADQVELFSAFKQLDHPMQKTVSGTGLGLSIAKSIVENLHGGVLGVESEPGRGSVFTFTLPLKRAETFVRRYECPRPEARCLLVVEDSDAYLDILVQALQPHYHLTVTNSVERAKEIVGREEFYYLLLDFFLVDGICTGILKEMRRLGIGIPVLVISAEDDSRIAANIGQSDLVEGVFSKDDIRLIGRVLGRAPTAGSPS